MHEYQVLEYEARKTALDRKLFEGSTHALTVCQSFIGTATKCTEASPLAFELHEGVAKGEFTQQQLHYKVFG